MLCRRGGEESEAGSLEERERRFGFMSPVGCSSRQGGFHLRRAVLCAVQGYQGGSQARGVQDVLVFIGCVAKPFEERFEHRRGGARVLGQNVELDYSEHEANVIRPFFE